MELFNTEPRIGNLSIDIFIRLVNNYLDLVVSEDNKHNSPNKINIQGMSICSDARKKVINKVSNCLDVNLDAGLYISGDFSYFQAVDLSEVLEKFERSDSVFTYSTIGEDIFNKFGQVVLEAFDAAEVCSQSYDMGTIYGIHGFTKDIFAEKYQQKQIA